MLARDALQPIQCPYCSRAFEARYADRRARVVCPLCANHIQLSPSDFEPLVLAAAAERRMKAAKRRDTRRKALKRATLALLKACPLVLWAALLLWFVTCLRYRFSNPAAAGGAVVLVGLIAAIEAALDSKSKNAESRPSRVPRRPPKYADAPLREDDFASWNLGADSGWLAGSWYDFETKVFLMFSKRGYLCSQTGPQAAGFDGTVSVPDEGVLGVEVKRFCAKGAYEVDARIVRKLWLDLHNCGLTKGLIATTGRIADTALREARFLPVEITFLSLSDLCREGRGIRVTAAEIVAFRHEQGIPATIPVGMVAHAMPELEENDRFPF